ncbi:MAG: hypothetical protein EBR09_11725 [Proteobacteria bacterium]|nr:hypothetical protein [Pseudomonadota bacterium]
MPDAVQNRKRITVLGAGFSGQSLFAGLSGQFDVRLTSRKGQSNGRGTPDDCVYFDSADRDSWPNVFESDFVIWTFPAATDFSGIAGALELAGRFLSRKIPVLVFASTSCYLVQSPDQPVDESCPLDESQHRVCAEEQLRRSGCMILALAGLYGAGRDPANWLRRGLIKNSEQFINLIHISDVVKIVRCWIENPIGGVRLNASDGRHRRWRELEQQLRDCGVLESHFPSLPSSAVSTASKKVCNAALLRMLFNGPFHLYPEEGL